MDKKPQTWKIDFKNSELTITKDGVPFFRVIQQEGQKYDEVVDALDALNRAEVK